MGGVIISVLLASIILSVLLMRNRGHSDDKEYLENTISGPPISGPPISQTRAPTVSQTVTNEINNQDLQQTGNGKPPIPEEGLPHGWTLEQWQYYGQQYLDMKNRQ